MRFERVRLLIMRSFAWAQDDVKEDGCAQDDVREGRCAKDYDY